jgi:hypothetical protein
VLSLSLTLSLTLSYLWVPFEQSHKRVRHYAVDDLTHLKGRKRDLVEGMGGGDSDDEGRRDRAGEGIVVVKDVVDGGDKKCVPSVIEVTTLSPQGCLI